MSGFIRFDFVTAAGVPIAGGRKDSHGERIRTPQSDGVPVLYGFAKTAASFRSTAIAVETFMEVYP